MKSAEGFAHHPLLQSQFVVFVECLEHPGSTQYNLPKITPLGRCEVDLDRLAEAFRLIYKSRSALRLRFGLEDDGTPYQYVDDTKVFDVSRIELSDEELHYYSKHGFCRPFDLFSDEPLVRVTLASTEKQDYLLIDFHHLAMDGMTVPLLMNDISAAYEYGALQGEIFSVTDAADEEKENFSGSAGERAKAYYTERFAGKSFASLSERTAAAPGRLLRVRETVDSEEVDLWCRRFNVPANLLFQAAFSHTVSTLLREDEIVYTTVSHGRLDRRWRASYGMFARRIPVFSGTKEGRTAIDYIRNFRREMFSAHRYSDYPLSGICTDMGLKPGISFNFMAQDAIEECTEIGGKLYQAQQIGRDDVISDIEVLVSHCGNQYEIRVESSEAVNTLQTLTALAKAVRTVLQRMMLEPDSQVNSISLSSNEEERAVIRLGTGERLDYDKSKTFVDLFKGQARKTPDNTAVADKDSELTYRQLDERSDALAYWLVNECDVRPNDFVAVKMPRVKEFIVAVIGIWKSGAAYVPVDPDYPEDRINFILSDSTAKLLLTEKNSYLRESFVKIRKVERAKPEGLAYMIYTSGSTGRPKGVMVRHSAYTNYLHFYVRQQKLVQTDRMGCHRNFTFDASLEDLFPILTVGGQLHIMPDEIRLDMAAIRKFIIDRKLTCVSFTTTLGSMLLQEYPDLPLRYMVVSGEKLYPIYNLKLPLWNFYGPTECTVDCITALIEPGRKYDEVPIGKVVPNLQAFVLDSNGHLLPRGFAGELCIAGPQVASGYWKRPELTAEKFVDCPFIPGEKMYRTGDLVRWNGEDRLEYIGRIDNQVKLRGFRVEMGEIEAEASNVEGVSQAVAVVRGDNLCLYYTGSAKEEQIKSKLSGKLADYMVPDHYVKMDVMPRTYSGKIDRKALPEPAIASAEYVGYADERERVVAESMASVLGLCAPVSMTERFVSMGGNSISAMRLSLALYKKGLSVSTSGILKLQTARAIAAEVAAVQAEVDLGETGVIDTGRGMPLHESARFVFIEWDKDRDTLKNNIPRALHFLNKDSEEVISALEKVFKAHPYLTAQFHLEDGVPFQKIHDDIPLEISRQTLPQLPDNFPEALVRPFDLLDKPLYHIEVFEVEGEKGCYLFIDFNHAIFDGYSENIFFRDFAAAFSGELTADAEIGAMSQYYREGNSQDNKQLASSDEYFDALLKGIAPTVFPQSHYRTTGKDACFTTADVPASAVDDYVQKSGITESSLFLTGIIASLETFADSSEVALTLGHAGRNYPEIADSIGMFVKTWPVVGRNICAGTWSEAAQTVSRQILDTSAIEYYPFERLKTRYGWSPEITYIYEGNMDQGIASSPEVETCGRPRDMIPSMVPLWIGVFNDGKEAGQYLLKIKYDGSLFSEKDVRRFADHIASTVLRGCRNPEEIIGYGEYLSDSDIKEIETLSNGENVPFDKSFTCVDAIVANAAENPEKAAIVASDGTLSYGELDKLSNKVANWLVREGAEAGDYVAMRLPESTGFYVAALGIMKAGCGYIPMDITYPEERLDFMQADSGSKILITPELLEEITSSKTVSSAAINLAVPDGPSMLLYTSGSTGQPKGACQQHKSLRTMAVGYIQDFEMSGQFNYAAVTSPSYALSLPDTYGALCAGATLHVPGPELRKDISGLSVYIKTHGIKGLGINTALGAALVNSHVELGIEYMILAGEKSRKMERPPFALWNGLGSTETHYMAYHRISGDEEVTPLGRPAPNMQALLLDSRGRRVPRGAVGELCIVGDQLVKGYWRREELDSERFINGVYHTGDLAFWNEDGELVSAGRKDNMVKVRGYRIELEEIERCAMKLESVTSVAAAVRGTESEPQICLFYTTTGKEINETDFKAIAGRLPAFMIPQRFVRLDEMPVNVRGKLDRKALPYVIGSEVCGMNVTPASYMERQIFAIASSILGHEDFGVTTNLLSAGLSSIGAMKLCFSIENQGIAKISMSDVLGSPTVRGIAERCSDASSYRLRRFGRVQPLQKYYYLTQNQTGLYIEYLKNPEVLQYNNPSLLFVPDITPEEFLPVVRKIEEAHPYLKCRIRNVNGNPMLERDDESDLAITIGKAPAEADMAQFFQSRVRPFNLEGGELCRIELYEKEDGTFVFSDLHHIITDGTSDGLLRREMKSLVSGNEIFAERYTAYDYAAEEHSYIESEAFSEDGGYFEQLLEGAESVQYPGSARKVEQGLGVESLTVDKSVLRGKGRDSGVTDNMLILSSLLAVIKSATMSEKPLVATVSSGREGPEMEHTVGFFAKTLPVVYADDIMALQRQLTSTMLHQQYPYTEMVSRFGINARILYVFEGGIGIERNRDEVENLKLDTAKFPITLTVYPKDENTYLLECEYDKSTYLKSDISMFLRSLDNVIATGNLVTEAEKSELLALGTGEKLDYDTQQTFVGLFRQQVKLTPEAVAVADKNGSITYRELDERSDAFAHWLIEESGVRPGEFVVVLLPRIKEFAVSAIGIMKAGAAYVPVDPEYPEERRRFMIEDCEAKVVVTEESLRACESHAAVQTPVDLSRPEGIAYMVYTSGSTGKPKGALVGHDGLLNYLLANIQILGLSPSERIASHCSFSFSAHIVDFYPALAAGASVYIMAEEDRKDIDLICGFFERYSITGCYLTSSLASLIYNNRTLNLRYLGATGEKVTGMVSGRNGVQVINGYGFSEGTDLSSTFLLKPGVEYREVPVGTPIQNCYVLILDKDLKLVPRGAAGELCFAGCQVGRGYWHRPELTAEKFVDCPYIEGTKMYLTGDLARWNSDGQLECLGRIDNQVKLRGFRIEISEVEFVATKVEDVDQALAAVRNDVLCLYYTGLAEEDAIKSAMSESLSEFMVPDIVVHLDCFPLNQNGKVDLKALPEPEINDAEMVLPATVLEQEIRCIVAESLKTEQFGVTTNLISAGMTSMAAMRLAMKLQQRYGTSIRMTDLMSHPTVRELAEHMETLSSGNSRYGTVHPILEYYPLTESQKGVYIDWERNRHGLQYNVPSALKMKDVDPERLAEAIRKVVDARPILKMRLCDLDGEIMQRRDDAREAEVMVSTLAAEVQVDAEATEAFFQSRVRPFNLFNDTLYRFEIYRSESATYLFKDIHHIVTDGLSEGRLTEEIIAAYEGQLIEKEEYTFYDYSLEPSSKEEDETYFRELIGDTKGTVYPKSKDADGEGRSRTVSIEIDKASIDAQSSKQGVTASNHILHSMMQVLRSITGEERVLIAAVSNGRSYSCMQSSQGFFAKTLPVLSENTAADLQSQFIRSISHEECPLTKTVELKGIHPEILYAYEGELYGESLKDKAIDTIPLNLDTPKMPISITVNPDLGDKYIITAEYNDRLYTEKDMLTLLQCVRTMSTEGRLVTEKEERRLMELGGGETLDYDRTKTFVDLFKEQARKTPDNIAVVDKESQLTYRELDEQSDAVAYRLIEEHGIEPDDFVAVMLPRRKEFVTSVLGIMKTGAAYVPIDPEYPEERKRFMMEDCEAKVSIDESWHLRESLACVPTFAVNRAKPEGLAYMIYTSGSTGEPKGVMLSHGGLINYVLSTIRINGIRESDRVSACRSFSFDSHIEEFYPSLAQGATVFIIDEEARKDAVSIADYLRDNRIDVCYFPTSLAALIYSFNDLSVRFIGAVGEKLAGVVSGKEGVRFLNTYGPTECTDHISTFWLEDGREYDNIPIGRPLANGKVFVLDRMQRMVPFGMTGELCFAGPQVAKGYWKSPDLTAEKFVDCPYLQGEKMYRTGDLVRWNGEGQLEYIGRIDNQIKLRGYRVEPGEIESAAIKTEGVSQAAAMVKRDVLCLYYTGEASEEEISSSLSERLPEYMVPGICIHLEAMPLTPNGKTDRKALPEPVRTETYIEPADEMEAKVCEAFQKVLKLERIGAADSFFRMGGNSIAAMKLVIIIRESGIGTLNVSDVITLQTPRLIAAHLDGQQTFCTKESVYSKPRDRHRKKTLDDIRSDRRRHGSESVGIVPSESNMLMLPAMRNTVAMKYRISSKVTLESALNAFSKIICRSGFEYSFDSSAQMYSLYPGCRSSIRVLDISEEEADSVILQLAAEGYEYDGKSLVSDVFAISPEGSENHMIYTSIQHSLIDRTSSQLIVEKMNRLLRGEQDLTCSAESCKAVLEDSRKVSADEFISLVKTLNGKFAGHDYERIVATQPLSGMLDDPIMSVMKVYASENTLLSDMDRIPLVILHNGRDASNFDKLGCFLKLVPMVVDLRTSESFGVDNLESLGNNELNGLEIPQVNYIGIFDDERTETEIMNVQKGYERNRRIHASVYNGMLVVKMPKYS